MKIFLNLGLHNVHSVRNKCCHLKDFVIDNYNDIFCMSENWLYDDNSANVSVLTPENYILRHAPRPGKKRW